MNHAMDHARHANFFLGRRRLLQIGGLGALGLNLTRCLEAEAKSPKSNEIGKAGKIQSCIVLYYYGGPSHLDTWDMKPNAPKEVRGEFQSIPTNVPGIRVCELMPRSAKIMDKLAVIRSMHHPMRNHNSAAVEALCGRTPLKGDLELLSDDPNSFPCYGAALSRLMPGRKEIPTHVALPHVMYNVVQLPGQNSGFLGASFNPFQVNRDPNNPDFKVDELQLPADLPLARLEDRQTLLGLVESQRLQAERQARAVNMTTFQERAFRILHSDAVRKAFDIERESVQLRDRYGRNTLGQSLLLARRLVEAGVRFHESSCLGLQL